eukprot:TRINITY_DN17626_c0_g1_i2.p1 TRINITY_DN17626_c0_g1~~TRINITY_DN17626_c0_g1_i2.p1  ORF type:complete len:483 (-),score=45.09 TRINITY_DN17626_c0_g1_i2:141-1589(-)
MLALSLRSRVAVMTSAMAIVTLTIRSLDPVLKGVAVTEVPKQNATPAASEPGFCTYFEDGLCDFDMHTDYPGKDVRQTKASHAHVCWQLCVSEKRCSCFTWKPSHNLCFMKADCDSVKKEWNSVSGMASCRQPLLDSFGQRTSVPLLTTIFHPQQMSDRASEIYNALAANMRNSYISEIHVLLETESSSHDCSTFLAALVHTRFGQACLSGTGIFLDKIKCSLVNNQPTFMSMIRYANMNLTKSEGFIMSHADVVFDSTLGLIDLKALRRGYAMVISVTSALLNGQYAASMGAECQEKFERCSPAESGYSWDAFVLAAPVIGNLQGDFVMNRMFAENVVAYQLWNSSGLTLINPCLHVRAYHWHCMAKSSSAGHSNAPGNGVIGQYPCWDCPAIATQHLCKVGYKVPITDPNLLKVRWNGRHISSHMLCCLSRASCQAEIYDYVSPAWRGRLCKRPTDVNCLLFAGSSEPDPNKDYSIKPWR